jgi:hypothetical protein
MTLQEWRSNDDLAIELKKLIDNPVMKNAFAVLDSMTLAKTLGASHELLKYADKSNVLFGYDAGRASFVMDLNDLATLREEPKEITPTYMGEF